MSVRHFASKTQHDYIRTVMKLTRFFGRSPDTATNEDLRRFQLHLTENNKVGSALSFAARSRHTAFASTF
jgi:integrase/recombinase XerD